MGWINHEVWLWWLLFWSTIAFGLLWTWKR